MSTLSYKNFKYEKKEVKIATYLIIAVFFLSLALYAISNSGKKYTFRFESVDTGLVSVENRLLPRRNYPENVLLYVDELVLGPKTERFKLLFSPETYILSSFVRDNVLYVNLSDDVLSRAGSCSEIKTGIELFKINVLNNFSKINLVEMYIDNKSIYTQEEVDD